MRDYELVLILSSQQEEDKVKKLVEKIEKTIAGLKGKVSKVDSWGIKDFSYPIKKQSQGFYVAYFFSMDEGKSAELDKLLLSDENILRHLLLRLDKRKE